MGIYWVARRIDAAEAARVERGELAPADALKGSTSEDADLDLDKAWDGLRQLLGRPASAAIDGGVAVGGEYVGNGPIHLVDADRVRVLAEQLAAVRPADLGAERLAMMEYPAGLGPQDREEILEYLPDLVEFYRAAADAGQAVLYALT